MATLQQLQYLLAVDQYRHFGKAAKACHVSQPTLSMQLHKLEDEYGVSLFDRSKQPILPTNEGVQIIEQAKAVMREAAKLEYLSKNSALSPQGEFRLGVIPTIAPYLLPLFIGSFAQRYIDVELSIEEMTTDSILDALRNDRIDAGILATPLPGENLIENPLYYEPFYLYVNPAHELARLENIREEKLNAKDIWLLTEGHCLRNQIVRICSLKGKAGIFPNVKFESGSLSTVINLVEQGHGYTLLPYLATLDLQKSKKAQIKPFVKPVPSREVSLVYRRTQYKTPIITALEEEIRRGLPKELPIKKSNAIEVIKI